MVLVASEAPSGHDGSGRPGRGTPQPAVAGPNGLNCTRIAAHAVGGSAEWSRRPSRQASVSPRSTEPIGPAAGRVADRPEEPSDILERIEQAHQPRHRERSSATSPSETPDAVIAGPLSPDDANCPGLLPHLADQADRAYRALRPPRELIVHPAFAAGRPAIPVHPDERAGSPRTRGGRHGSRHPGPATCRLQGDPGEFAITAFAGHGLLWADDAWWEIEPIGNVNETITGAISCMAAWVMARTGSAGRCGPGPGVCERRCRRSGETGPLEAVADRIALSLPSSILSQCRQAALVARSAATLRSSKPPARRNSVHTQSTAMPAAGHRHSHRSLDPTHPTGS